MNRDFTVKTPLTAKVAKANEPRYGNGKHKRRRWLAALVSNPRSELPGSFFEQSLF